MPFLVTLADGILARWSRHRTWAMRLAVCAMIGLGVAWLTYEFWRLLSAADPIWPTSPRGAVDIMLRRREVDEWFGEAPLVVRPSLYPPASYVMLWPLIGWLDMSVVRALWAFLSLGCLLWLVRLTVAHGRTPESAETSLERRFLAWIPVSMYATGATIGNGQHVIHVLPMLVAAILVACRPNESWLRDLLAAALFVGALVKPQLSAPFFWILAFVPGRLRPAALTAIGYGLLTLVAWVIQPVDLLGYAGTLEASACDAAGSRFADVGVLLCHLGLTEWLPAVTLFILAGLGVWTLRHRQADLWLLLGVTALVTRGLTYHRWYDDLLLLLPLITLFRIANSQAGSPLERLGAGLLFAATWLSLLAPGFLYLLPRPLATVSALIQTGVWLSVLIYLVARTGKPHEPAQPRQTSP